MRRPPGDDERKGEQNFRDVELRKIFDSLKKIAAPERAVSGVYARIRKEAAGVSAAGDAGTGGRAAGAHPRAPLRATLRVAFITAALTLCISVPLTFLAARRGAVGKQTAKLYIVRFIYENRNAESVTVIGDFNNWQKKATRMSRLPETSFWVVDIPLSEGLYRYAFLIDDEEWAVDPLARIRMKDDSGKDSSLIVLVNETDERVEL